MSDLRESAQKHKSYNKLAVFIEIMSEVPIFHDFKSRMYSQSRNQKQNQTASNIGFV